MLDILVRTTVLFLVAGAATSLLRNRSASLRHLAWSLAIVGALSLPLVTSISPLRWPVLPSVGRESTARVPSPRAATNEQLPLSSAHSMESSSGGAAAGLEHVAPERDVSGMDAVTGASIDLRTVLLTTYAAGAAVLLGWLVLGCAIVRRRAARAEPVDDPAWNRLLQAVARDLSLSRLPALRRSRDASVPFAAGVWRPVIVLPASSEAWTPAQRRAVLLHEAAHISRGDLSMNLLSYLARALYWINPLAWMAARRLRVEGEKACDDMVLACGARASDYADHLLRVVQSTGCPLPAVALAMARGSDFEGRLVSILSPNVPRHRVQRSQLAGACALAGLAVVGVSIASPAEAASPAFAVLPAAVAPAKVSVQVEASSRAVAALVVLLTDADANVRLTAAQSLQNLQDPAAIAALAKALKEDTDARVREAAADALGEIRDTRAVPHLMEALRAERASRVRARIIDALRALNDARAASAIIPTLRDQSADVRRSAVSALEELRDVSAIGALQALVRDPDVDVRRRLASALGSFEDAATLDAILVLARDADAEVRAQAVEALHDIADARVAPALLTALADRDAHVRQQAADGLGHIEGMRSAPRPLIDALGDGDAEVRRSAAHALGNIGDEAAVPSLQRLLGATDVETRRAVVEALKEIGGARAVEAMLALLKDSDAEIRRMAAEALGKRREE